MVVVIVVAAVLAALGMPLFGALEFVAGTIYVAGRSVRAMRTATPPQAGRPLPLLEQGDLVAALDTGAYYFANHYAYN
ncbi:hypothetical protein ABZ353_36755, partial [Streptomyces niveus]